MLAPAYQALFAISSYTGMRKGEALSLQRQDVNLRNRRVMVGRSWTKNKRRQVIPIHSEAVPWFERAPAESNSTVLVFPGADGKMKSRDTKLHLVLRRALARAGIVDHWLHRCRKHGCAHEEQAQDGGVRRCPRHKVKLWPKPIAREIRWHALRHTAATLLLQAGASLAVVQRLLRHSTPAMTNRNAHLTADWSGGEIERLRLVPAARIDTTSTHRAPHPGQFGRGTPWGYCRKRVQTP